MNKTTVKKRKGIFLIILGLVIIIVPLALESSYRMVGPEYVFQNTVHSHMVNAYYSNTPELMIDQLEQVVSGFKGFGLDETMYGAWLPWELTPDRSMHYQYQHLESILERAHAVQKWRNDTYGMNTTGSETLGDVYEAKMDNLRFFLTEGGWSDWIGYRAFMIHYYLWLVIYGIFISIILLIVGLFVVLFGIFRLGVSEEWWFADDV